MINFHNKEKIHYIRSICLETRLWIQINIDCFVITEIDFSCCSISISGQCGISMEIFIARKAWYALSFARAKRPVEIFLLRQDSPTVFLYFPTSIFRDVCLTLLFSAFACTIDTVIIISHLFLNRNIYHELCRNGREKENAVAQTCFRPRSHKSTTLLRGSRYISECAPRESDFLDILTETGMS